MKVTIFDYFLAFTVFVLPVFISAHLYCKMLKTSFEKDKNKEAFSKETFGETFLNIEEETFLIEKNRAIFEILFKK